MKPSAADECVGRYTISEKRGVRRTPEERQHNGCIVGRSYRGSRAMW